jgi:hypothetical protein
MNKINILLVLFLSAFCLIPSAYAQGGVKGKVRNNKGGSIGGATVTARQNGKDVKTVTADSKGSFQMEGLKAGTYNIAFDADGYSTGVKFGVEIKNGSVRDMGDRLILSVDQGTQIIIKGSVFYKEGTSLTAAKIELERINDDGSTKSLGSTYSNYSGEFSFRPPVGVRKVRVTAKYKGVEASKEISDISNTGIYRTAITLDISRSNN